MSESGVINVQKTVIGIFSSEEDAQTAVEDLETAGYETKDISIMMKNRTSAERFANDTGTNVANSAVSGAVTGGVIGGIAGLLIGIGAIAVPGIGALLIGGPIATALGVTGAAATTVSGATTGILAGGLIGALMGLGVPREDAAVYEERIKQGGILVAIPAQEGREEDVMAILEDNGADQIRAIEASIPSESAREEVYEDPVSSQNGSYEYTQLGIKGGKSRAASKKTSPERKTRVRKKT